MSRTRDMDWPSPVTKPGHGPSRIAHFSPFRKGVAPSPSLSGDGVSISGAREGRGLGNVSDVPSVPKASAPPKPPKPVGLRVKKAKALSISLLTGNTGIPAFHQQESSTEGATSVAQKRQSRVLLPCSPPIQQQHTPNNLDDDTTLPVRSQSSIGFYQEFGPQKGLASQKWNDSEPRERLYSKKKKLSDTQMDRSEGKNRSDELFIISRRASITDNPTSAAKAIAPHNGIEIMAQETRQRSQSSLGMASVNSKRQTSPPPSAAAALPLLNPYTAKEHSRTLEAKTKNKKRSTPSPLSMSSTTRRSSLFNSLDRGPNSAPLTSSSRLSSPAQPAASGSHARTASTLPQNGFVSHIPLPKMLPRYRTQSHAAALDYKSLPASALSQEERVSLPLSPPPRHKHNKSTIGTDGIMLRVPGNRLDEDHLHPRSSSPFERGGALQVLGQQLGGIGVAVGKRGWDMVKSWNNAGPSSPLSSHPARGPFSAPVTYNEATKIWIAAPEATSSIPTKGGSAITPGMMRSTAQGGGVFGKPLREAVLSTRLAQGNAELGSIISNARLSALDLGTDFSIYLPELEIEQRQQEQQRAVVDREEARRRYLPAIVVRCVEAIEKWGVEEEGIYRLSGRSSHTAKLKVIFDRKNGQNADLQLVDIGPAELDLNSVCSLLKAYLRSLPDLLLTSSLSKEFNEAVKDACGLSAVGDLTINGNTTREQAVRERQETDSLAPCAPATQSQRVAIAITPLMNKLPAVNWYLLRELAYHLGDLTREDNVQKTKMTLSNLCLVLAPTLSLSVAMVRMLVEAREQLFNETCPLADGELDLVSSQVDRDHSLSSGVVCLDRASPLGQASESSRPSSRLALRDNDWMTKRTSVATVKCLSDLEKRNSTSSMATLQEAGSTAAGNEGSRGNTLALRPTSDMFGLGSYSMGTGDTTAALFIHEDEDNDESLAAPPIAAKYLRKRSSSIASNLSSMQYHISKAPSSTSLYSNGLHAGSTIDSSAPSSSDRDSPRTADDHWPTSASNMASLGGVLGTSSSGSLASLYKSSGTGAMDRPRPTTPNPTRFFSR